MFSQYDVRISAMKKSSEPYVQDINCHVMRNEAWEPYLDHATNCASCFGLRLNLSFSGFADMVDFEFLPASTENLLIWLNWSRLSLAGIDFTLENISQAITDGVCEQIYVVPPSNSDMKIYEYVVSHNKSLGISWVCKWGDKPSGKISNGYYKSEIEQVIHYVGIELPQFLSNTLIRGLILDFDNTLYEGIFAEDGVAKIDSNAHRSFREQIKSLSDTGVLLAGATKNNASDVASIFEYNILTPLKKEDFIIIESGWLSKAESISRIIKATNLNELNLLFIDDNKREIIEVGSNFSNLLSLDASNTEELMGVVKNSIMFERDNSALRVKQRQSDVKARIKRKNKNLNDGINDDLLLKLNTKVQSFRAKTDSDYQRAFELFRKTNQFNFTFNRLNHLDYSKAGVRIQPKIYVCSLIDDISNSGIIAAMAVIESHDALEIIEFCISCRALGRSVEKYIFYSLLRAANVEPSINVKCNFNSNTRNLVAQSFSKKYFIGEGEITLNYDRFKKSVINFEKLS